MKGESQPAVRPASRVRQLGPNSEPILKQSPSRSVRVVEAEGGRRVIVKRFKSARFSLGRDRSRARNEYEVLAALHASGAPVPQPLELRPPNGRGDGAWEVSMEWFPEAIPLQDIFDGSQPWPTAPEHLAVELGRLVAGLHARRLDHPDLHAGNVLVQPDWPAGPSAGSPARRSAPHSTKRRLIAIDFHKARIQPRLEPELLESHLVQLAAGTREFVSARFRARFALAWRANLPERMRRGLPPPAELARRIEARARPMRREVVHRRQARWTREGTAVQPLERGVGWVRVGSDPGRIDALRVGGPRAGAPQFAAPQFGPSGAARPRELVLQRDSVHDLLNIWQVAARLFEHRLPTAAPLALVTAPRRWMALELPDNARLAQATEVDAARAQLEALLADRGLKARLGDEHVWVDGTGEPLIVGLGALEDA